jgi:hypothetical protein
MSKACLVCSTENRDEAQFCRACGTSFAAAVPAPSVAEDGTCAACGFRNASGVQWCANCGVAIGSVPGGSVPDDAPSAERAEAVHDDAIDPLASETTRLDGFGASPPPLSHPSYPPVAPYPGASAGADPLQAFAAEPATVQDAWRPAASAADGSATDGHAPAPYPPYADPSAPPPTSPSPSKTIALVAGIAALVLAAGVGAWWFAGGAGGGGPSAASAPAVAASLPAPAPPVAPLPVEPSPLGPPPMSAAPLPQVGDPPAASLDPAASASGPAPASATASAVLDPEAQRLAAERRRERLAKEKADRDVKAKALLDERDREAAIRLQQDAATAAQRRREEDAGLRRPQASPTAPAAAVTTQPRSVREICGGRGTIAQAVCESRTCGEAQHAGEAICRQIREADERRRNYNN